ncbi:MFS transporter [Dongshaea marina]|uniref:MFS transporter n=1 Tax=Dongshaea marina TaxID=2047966 RepID=UPI001F16CA68|nr:MFS transporter [Dongshaea marina]
MKLLSLMKQSDSASFAFLVVTFLTGTAIALQFSTLSLFLANDVHANPLLIGVFYTANAVAGIMISQWLAHHSDRGSARKRLIIYCCLAGTLMSILFALNRNFWILLILGVLLSSIASTASPSYLPLPESTANSNKKAQTCLPP